MAQQDEEQLDGMLQGFFSDSLDSQQGRSELHFRRHLMGVGQPDVAPTNTAQTSVAQGAWRNRTLLLGAFITGMAASVAVIWAAPLFHAAAPATRQQVVETREQEPASPPTLPAITRVVQSHTTDEGIVVTDDNTPFHVLRRRQIERTRWLDGDRKVEAEQVTPQDDLVYVKVPTY
jgi:hypothetical protein